MQTVTNKSVVESALSMPSNGKHADLHTNDLLDTNSGTGLTSTEASHRLEKFGPNAVADTTVHPLRIALTKFWSPVPWMLEAAILLQVVIGEYVGAAVVAGLLAFNAALGFFQEGRAQATLAAMKSRLAMTAMVRRNSVWTTLPAAELVPGDIVKLSLGVVVAADMHLIEGSVLLDQSMLTGELILGPTNPAREAESPSRLSPPPTDHGTMPNLKWSFADSHNRLLQGGWQTTVREMPVAKEIAGVNMRLKAGAIRELHWHKEGEWAL